MIKTIDVIRSFPVGTGEELQVLKGINMEVPEGKLTILKGRSGSGKTTLLNILSALDNPTSGAVYFEGKEIGNITEKEREQLRRTKMGFVFQAVALIPVMNAYENVEFELRLSGYKGRKRRMKKEAFAGQEADLQQRVTDDWQERTRQCLELVGLKDRMQHMPGEMSGGEQQRIAIARAIVHRPKVIFADEPTGALDTNTGLAVMHLFKELIEKEGITIVMTTHDTNLMEFGDVVYEMEDGQLV